MTIGTTAKAALALLADPEQQLQQVQYSTPDGWQQSLAWGVRTGPLVTDAELAKLECRKSDGGTGDYETHPEYTGTQATETRYCEEALWGGPADDSLDPITTTYSILIETRPSYQLTQVSDGAVVQFSLPQTLYWDVPENATLYAKDAGKRITLEHQGFGNLNGIPGTVFDTDTGEEVGEFVNQWKDSYRYISRFTLPDGATLTDAADTQYKVKALNGEEWLSEAPASIGTYTYTASTDDLVPDSVMKNLGESSDNAIGATPTTLINGGEPVVVHGEVVCDPTPSDTTTTAVCTASE